jgi:drug/metabolite transporter (DMT)-like permease
MSKEKFSVKGAQALFAASFTYAFTGVLVRAMSSMWGDKAQVAVRYALVFIVLLLYGFVRKTQAKIPRHKLLYAVALGFMFALVVLFFTFAIQKTTIANSLFTFYATNMIVSFVFGTFILRERVSKSKLVAIIFALAGLSFYAGALVAGSPGIIFGILAGVCAGVTNVLYKLLSGVDRSAVVRMQYGIGTVFTVLVTWFSGDQIIRKVSLHGMVTTVVFALVLIVAANLLIYGYQHFDVNIGTVILSMELVFGTLLGFIFYGEVPAVHEFLGGALIFAGSVLSSLDLDKLLHQSRA